MLESTFINTTVTEIRKVQQLLAQPTPLWYGVTPHIRSLRH